MAALAVKAMQCIGKADGDPPLMGNAPLLAGKVPNKGDVVFKDANGKIDEAGADPANIAGIMAHEYNETFAGTFDGTADLLQSTASSDMIYFRAHADNRFEGSFSGVLARTDEGKAYGIAKAAGGEWYIDNTDTTNTKVTILKILNDDIKGLIGDTYARVVFRFSTGYQE